MKDNERMYTDLAWAWPIISPPEDYTGEAERFRSAIVKRSKIPVNTLLDMGCGGGHNDFHLKRHFQVTGTDISTGMLENARRLNPDVDYQIGDMRTAGLGKEFDAVIIADSIMYMLSEEDLLAAFRTAFAHLKPGGIFCTYAEELKATFSTGTYSHRPMGLPGSEITLIEHKWDPDPLDTSFEFLFLFLIRDGPIMRVETDRHTCGLFPLATWKRLLGEAGFSAKVTKWHQGEVFFSCLKPEK